MKVTLGLLRIALGKPPVEGPVVERVSGNTQ